MRYVPPTSTYHLVDRILDGDLTRKLDAWRAEGLSYEAIAFRLRSEHDITVSTATVCRWVASPPAARTPEPENAA